MSDDTDLEALRAERDALADEVAALRPRRRGTRRFRGLLAVVGVVLSCALLLTATLGVWARRSFLKTDVFSERAGGLVDEPAVRDALSAFVAAQLSEVIDAESVLADALPDRAALLAVPLANAVDGFVADQVASFVDTDAFARLWKGAVTVAHERAIRVLEGEAELVQAGDGGIVINLIPVLNAVLAEIGEVSPTLFGRTVDLPTVTVDDVPDEARDAIGDALGITLDDDFGTFTVYDDGKLAAAQDGLQLANRLVWLLVVLTPLAIAGTIAVSPRRRRTVLQLAVGAAVAMVVLRRLLLIAEDQLLALVRVEANRPAVDVTASAFLDPLFDGAGTLLALAAAIVAVALVTGPYPWAVGLRRRAVDTTRQGATLVAERARDEETAAFAQRNLDALRLAGGAIGLALLWWVDLTWARFVVLAAVVVAWQLGVAVLARRADAPAAPAVPAT